MSRRATAVLEVQVQDSQLDRHLEKLEAVRSAWTFLGGSLADLTTAFSKGSGDELTKVSKAIAAMASVKAGGGAPEVVDALVRTKPGIAGLTGELEKAADVTKRIADDSVRWARALTKAATEVGRLETRTDSLISSQERTSVHMQEFEAHLDKTTQKLRTQGKEMLELIQAYAGFNKAVNKTGGGGAGSKAGGKDGSIRGFLGTLADFERSFIRHATTLFISGQWFKHAAEAFRDAAAQIDLENVLGRSLDDFGHLLERTRESTRGMVSDIQIMKSAALMSSFKIPMENFAENMELVQKMAVRTGQDTTYMFDSLARGVSRLSPAILDNLGIQIKLKDAYEAGAAALGVGVDKLDKQAQKTAVLAEVTRQMADATKEVDPAASLQARIEQMEASYTNFTQKLKGAVLQAVLAIAATEEERLAIASDRIKLLIKEQEIYEKTGKAISASAQNVILATGAMSQKDVDTLLMFGQFNPMNILNAMAQGHGTVNEMLTEQLKTQNLIYDTTGKTLEQNRRAAELHAEALFDQRNLVMFLDLEASTRERIKTLQEEIDNGKDPVFGGLEPDWSGEVAAQRQFLNDVTSAKLDISEFLHRIDDMRKSVADSADEIGGIEGKLFGTEGTKALNEIQEKVKQIIRDLGSGKLSFNQVPMELAALALDKVLTSTRALSREEMERYNRAHASELITLKLADQRVSFREAEIELLQGTTQRELDLARAQTAAKEALEEYNTLKENSIVLGAGEASATNKAILDAEEKLRLAQEEYAYKIQMRDLESSFQRYMEAGKFGAQELKNLEFERLSGGRSRLQIETELAKLGKELLATEMKRAEVSKTTTESEFMALTIETLKKEQDIAKLQKLLDSIKMPTGGGGRDKTIRSKFYASNKKPAEMEEWEYAVDTFKQDVDGIVSFSVQKFRTGAKQIAELLDESSEVYKANTLGTILSDQNVDEAIENNYEIMASIQALVDKYDLTLTPEMTAFMSELDRENQKLIEHRDLVLEVAGAMEKWAGANEWAWEGAQGLIGDDFIESFTNFGSAVKDVSDKLQSAMQGEANGYDVLLAGMGGIRAFTSAFIKDRRDRAKIEALMNGAAAFAAAGYGNWPAAAAHAQAAIMYGLVAGGRVRLPSESRKDTKDAEAKNNNGGPLHIHIEAPAGMTEGMMGYSIERSISIARAEGRL